MKTAVKILTALAAIAGAVYVIATYGDQIVAWSKKIMAAMPKCPCCEKEEAAAEEVAEEVPVVAEEEPAVEVTIEVPAQESEPVAEESDFEA